MKRYYDIFAFYKTRNNPQNYTTCGVQSCDDATKPYLVWPIVPDAMPNLTKFLIRIGYRGLERPEIISKFKSLGFKCRRDKNRTLHYTTTFVVDDANVRQFENKVLGVLGATQVREWLPDDSKSRQSRSRVTATTTPVVSQPRRFEGKTRIYRNDGNAHSQASRQASRPRHTGMYRGTHGQTTSTTSGPRRTRIYRGTGKAFNSSGLKKSKRGDYRGALRDYEKAIELNPDYAPYHFNCGSAILKLYEECDSWIEPHGARALRHLSRAISLKPSDMSAYQIRGKVYYHLENYEKAIADFDMAIRHDQRNEGGLYALRGIAKCRNGNYREGLSDFFRAKRMRTNLDVDRLIDVARKEMAEATPTSAMSR